MGHSAVLHFSLPQASTRDDVEAQLRDWHARLNGLFNEIDVWVEGVDGVQVERSSLDREAEAVAREVGIERQQDPVLTLHTDRLGIAFFPRALWTLGANGRVDVTVTGGPQHMLVDLGGRAGKRSDWRLVVDPSNVLRPFDRSALLKLLRLR